MSKIPYTEEPKRRRGRPRGTKNPPGHNAGRPSNGNGKSYGAVAPIGSSSSNTGINPGRPFTPPARPLRVAYDTPVPPGQAPPAQPPPQAPAGGNSNGNGRKPPKPKICNNPLPNLPAKNLPAPVGYGVMAAVAQAGLNPELITPEQLLGEIQVLATSDIRLIPGCPEGIPDEIAPAISSFTIIKTTRREKDGTEVETEQLKYTLWSKTSAQDQLSRYHGLYAKDKTPINAQFNQFNQMNINPAVDLSRLTNEELELYYQLRCKVEGGDILDLESRQLVAEGL